MMRSSEETTAAATNIARPLAFNPLLILERARVKKSCRGCCIRLSACHDASADCTRGIDYILRCLRAETRSMISLSVGGRGVSSSEPAESMRGNPSDSIERARFAERRSGRRCMKPVLRLARTRFNGFRIRSAKPSGTPCAEVRTRARARTHTQTRTHAHTHTSVRLRPAHG